jgi:hypothetical protein
MEEMERLGEELREKEWDGEWRDFGEKKVR